MSVETEDAFQKELVELFVQEAQEWLQQIHVALDELQQSPPLERHRALAQTIKVGITNLGGSAATLNLSDVERASFSTLPFVEAVQNPSTQISVDDFIALCKHLGHIHGALTRSTGVSFEEKHVPAFAQDSSTKIPTKDFLILLRDLHTQRQTANRFQRNLIQTMVAQAEGLLDRKVEQCDVASIHEFLDRSAEGDQGFLNVVRQAVPQLRTILQTLKNDRVVQNSPSLDLQNPIEHVAQLWSAAQQVNASNAMVFFMGLHSFLVIVTQHHAMVNATHFDAIQSRLGQNMEEIEEWAESGRMERVAIQNVLPH
ncbi:MAG: hypothetical protein A4E19_12605 [Nitrospira sp. SG-bin1]|nr:MAG: hypothetical protein A4E19_12605 [Nitrospira sp. SG-bin1]